MTNKSRLIAYLIIICLAFCSCEKEIKLNLDKVTKKLVVNSIICPDSMVTVNVYYSQNAFENQQTVYSNTAKVLLFEEGIFLDSLKLIANGKYQSDYWPKSNKTYSLEVLDGNNFVTSTCRVPEKAMKFSAKTDTTYDEIGYPHLGLNILLNDNVVQKNFYRILLTGLYVYPRDNRYFKVYTFSFNDEALNNQTSPLDALSNYINGEETHNYTRTDLVFSDKSFNGQGREIKLSEIISKSKVIYIHLHTLSEDYFKYLYSIKNKPEGNFSDPTDIYSNIDNGLGLFAAYNDLVDSVRQ